MVLRKLDVCLKKKEIDPYLRPYTNINSKLIKDLNVRSKIREVLGEY
jgi:hypothetical protein